MFCIFNLSSKKKSFVCWQFLNFISLEPFHSTNFVWSQSVCFVLIDKVSCEVLIFQKSNGLFFPVGGSIFTMIIILFSLRTSVRPESEQARRLLHVRPDQDGPCRRDRFLSKVRRFPGRSRYSRWDWFHHGESRERSNKINHILCSAPLNLISGGTSQKLQQL